MHHVNPFGPTVVSNVFLIIIKTVYKTFSLYLVAVFKCFLSNKEYINGAA